MVLKFEEWNYISIETLACLKMMMVVNNNQDYFKDIMD